MTIDSNNLVHNILEKGMAKIGYVYTGKKTQSHTGMSQLDIYCAWIGFTHHQFIKKKKSSSKKVKAYDHNKFLRYSLFLFCMYRLSLVFPVTTLSLAYIFYTHFYYLKYHYKNIITSTTFDHIILTIVSFSLMVPANHLLYSLVVWKLITNKKYYKINELFICLSVAITSSYISILGGNLLIHLLSLSISLFGTINLAYLYYNSDINIANLFCIKTPRKNQLKKIMLNLATYLIVPILLLSMTFIPSMVFTLLTSFRFSTHLYLFTAAQIALEEILFRVYLIKFSVNEKNEIQPDKAIILSLISNIIFTYLHRFNAPYKAIMRSSTHLFLNFFKCFLVYGFQFFLCSLYNTFISFDNFSATCSHFVNNVISFTYGLFYRSENQRYANKHYNVDVLSEIKSSSVRAYLFTYGSSIPRKLVKSLGADLDIEYLDQKVDTQISNNTKI